MPFGVSRARRGAIICSPPAAARPPPCGRCANSCASFARYHAARLRFAVGYLDAVAATRDAGVAAAAGRRSDALTGLAGALAHLTKAVQEYAAVAADNSDRGAIASINEYGLRFLRTTRDRLYAESGERW